MRGAFRESAARNTRGQRRVRSYSRLVTWMKIALPLAAVGLVALLFLSMRDKGDLTELFTPEELATLGAGLKLENPRFAGVTSKDEPFALRAEWALPDSAVPTYIDLEHPSGEIRMADGRTVSATAVKARLNRIEKTLLLEGGVVLDTSDGYHVETERVEIDIDGETAIAPGPVSGSGPRGEIQAGSMRASSGTGGKTPDSGPDAGGQIWFENKVRLVFIPAKDGG